MRLKDLLEKLKKKWQDVGYTCDVCDGEIFDYPVSRLCADCKKSLVENDGLACPKCGRATVTEGVCLNCKKKLPLFDKGLSPYVYFDEVAGVINRLKSGRPYLSRFLGEQMADRFLKEETPTENTVVVYVPLHREKRLSRGYDQAEKLAKVVADRLRLPLIPALVCVGKKEAQKELSLTERQKNVAGTYRVKVRKAVKDKRVLLIDDVMTTGATGSECADRLKRAGAAEVYFLTAASLPERK
ncbi:MAG: ComF family protein [Clostridia bacterium]|nr:ComF family protein [Clostridia bacterium]